ncbi:MAG TPA: LysR family transcriptional regulator [Steroidobacteraceae bacterium]|nr:LysR family transcriptional regulator [Steroidobacteraceae bacterium]
MLNETAVRRVDLDLLLLFQVVLRERHVGRAAGALHVSPSAVSHGLKRLRALFRDPLFLRTPKGVVPTARALQLAEPVSDVLGRAQQLLAGSRSFTPATSDRSYTIGTLDAAATSFLPPLLARIRRVAPGVRVELKHVGLDDAFAELDAHRSDLLFMPLADSIPARFEARKVYQEEFVVAAPEGHPFLKRPTLHSFCNSAHLLVSPAGGARGFIDDVLAARGLKRQVSVVVPTFLLGMAALAGSSLVGTMPRSVVERHAKRFRLRTAPIPLPVTVPRSTIYAVVPKVALRDAGIAWMFELLLGANPGGRFTR